MSIHFYTLIIKLRPSTAISMHTQRSKWSANDSTHFQCAIGPLGMIEIAQHPSQTLFVDVYNSFWFCFSVECSSFLLFLIALGSNWCLIRFSIFGLDSNSPKRPIDWLNRQMLGKSDSHIPPPTNERDDGATQLEETIPSSQQY